MGRRHDPSTWAGFLYLAVVLDAFIRKVAGWTMGELMTAELVLAALNMALHTRRPEEVIHHSDQGRQDTSLAFGGRCREMGVKPSMGSVGGAYDNAMGELLRNDGAGREVEACQVSLRRKARCWRSVARGLRSI